MAKEEASVAVGETIEIDLHQPGVAALWAWLWPGAGHIYQRRYAKGVLFMVCILTTYFFGLTLGGGHVVYASWDYPNDFRWQYICQLGVGLPALPAIVQRQRVRNGNDPWFDGLMAPPGKVLPNSRDQLAEWHERYHTGFELGTLYTMIAGLLNVLVIYDALAGPVIVVPEKKSDKPPPDKEDDRAKGG